MNRRTIPPGNQHPADDVHTFKQRVDGVVKKKSDEDGCRQEADQQHEIEPERLEEFFPIEDDN